MYFAEYEGWRIGKKKDGHANLVLSANFPCCDTYFGGEIY